LRNEKFAGYADGQLIGYISEKHIVVLGKSPVNKMHEVCSEEVYSYL